MNKIEQAMLEQEQANKCYLIDENFREITQKRIAVAMGKVASLPDSNGANVEILNELAEIRSFFQRKDLRAYSDKLKNSINMERFIDPSKPIIQG